MFACLTNALAGGKTRFSCSTVSMLDDMLSSSWPAILRAACLPDAYANTITNSRTCKDNRLDENPQRSARAAPAAVVHLRQPLAAAAALPRPDRRTDDLCVGLLAGALLPGDGHVRRRQCPHPRSRLGHRGGWRAARQTQ